MRPMHAAHGSEGSAACRRSAATPPTPTRFVAALAACVSLPAGLPTWAGPALRVRLPPEGGAYRDAILK